MKKPLIILTGPTAVGKTAASIGLAKAIGGEIISADSMQVYRHMDIGSAKIRPKEMQGISHHLIDVLEPEEEFHVVKFQQMAKEALDGIYQRGHIPIVVFRLKTMRRIIPTGKSWKNWHRKKVQKSCIRCCGRWMKRRRLKFMPTM